MGFDFRRVTSALGQMAGALCSARDEASARRLLRKSENHLPCAFSSQPIRSGDRTDQSDLCEGWVDLLCHRRFEPLFFGYVRDWVEKKIRRHSDACATEASGASAGRGGVGGGCTNRIWALFGRYRVSSAQAAAAKSAPSSDRSHNPCVKRAGKRVVREIRMLRTTWRELETEQWDGLRHRHVAKAAGNCNSPRLKPPRLLSTLPGGSDEV